MPLDIGVGIFLAIGASRWFGVPLDVELVTASIIFALLPDADYLAHLASGGTSKNAHRHRELLHYPLLFIPIGALVASFFGGVWVFLFSAGALAHFFHDSIGIGWGVQWLYPFSRDHFSFLYRYRPPDKEPVPGRFAPMLVWKHEDLPALVERYGDEHWIRNIYGRWHPYAIVEYAVFLIALAALYISWR